MINQFSLFDTLGEHPILRRLRGVKRSFSGHSKRSAYWVQSAILLGGEVSMLQFALLSLRGALIGTRGGIGPLTSLEANCQDS